MTNENKAMAPEGLVCDACRRNPCRCRVMINKSPDKKKKDNKVGEMVGASILIILLIPVVVATAGALWGLALLTWNWTLSL